MSEYQFYAFRAIDRPLGDEQMRALRSLSTRATITPTSFENSYNWGSFRGDPQMLMEGFFDAHVYVCNFNTYVFMLRLPRTVLPEEDLAPFAVEDVLNWWTTDEHVIVEWRLDEEYGDASDDGEEWIGRLVPIRDELVRGDLRSLYIGWLRSVQFGAWQDLDEEECDDEADESAPRSPRVPDGFGSLTSAQTALCEFLQLDGDLLEAAAAACGESQVSAASPIGIVEWVSGLPVEEVRAMLTRIIAEDGTSAQTELRSRYFRSKDQRAPGGPPNASAYGPSAEQLLALAGEIECDRVKREEEEKERQRCERLEAMVPRFDSMWAAADTAAGKRSPKGYEEACALLKDLRDAHVHAGRKEEFDAVLAAFEAKYTGRPAFMAILKKAGLTPEQRG